MRETPPISSPKWGPKVAKIKAALRKHGPLRVAELTRECWPMRAGEVRNALAAAEGTAIVFDRKITRWRLVAPKPQIHRKRRSIADTSYAEAPETGSTSAS